MAKEKAPAMPFYGREFYDDENVLVMDLQQQGAYMKLLWKCWSEGSIPADQEKIAAIIRVSPAKLPPIWAKLEPCFIQATDGRLVNRKVEEIREKRNTWLNKCSTSGKIGAEIKKQKRGTLKGTLEPPCKEPLADPSGAIQGIASDTQAFQFPVSSFPLPPIPPAAKTLEPTDPLWQAWDRFIERYPNRIEVDHAAQIWLSMIDLGLVTDAMIPDIEAGLTRWVESDQWMRDDGRYIPSPVKWLRDKRWLDHPPASTETKAERRGMKRSSDGIDPNAEWVAPWAAEKDVA
jgi:uncharacterized protein YdaU (DUF1376 family)